MTDKLKLTAPMIRALMRTNPGAKITADYNVAMGLWRRGLIAGDRLTPNGEKEAKRLRGETDD